MFPTDTEEKPDTLREAAQTPSGAQESKPHDEFAGSAISFAPVLISLSPSKPIGRRQQRYDNDCM